jgi:MIP family channel proteins
MAESKGFVADAMAPDTIKGGVAEGLAVCLFVYLCCGSAVAGGTLVSISLSFGFVILVLAHCIGAISGGHINPAVTLGLAAFGKVTPGKAVVYIVMQFVGGILGALFLWGTMPEDGVNAGCLGANIVHNSMTDDRAFGLEVITTFVLVFTVFATIDPDNATTAGLGPFPIAMAVMVCHLISIPLTGCGINPARSFGPAVISGMASDKDCDEALEDYWIFLVGPALGGVLGAAVYTFLFSASSVIAPAKPEAKGTVSAF